MSVTQIDLPELNHPEVGVFFKHDLSIPKELVQPLFDLPRATLIEDLCALLKHATEHVEAYSAMDWNAESHEFVLHSFWMLTDLKAKEALPNLLTFLGAYEDHNLDVFLGDYLIENMWEIIYVLGEHDVSSLEAFAFNPNHYSFARGEILTAITHIALYQPARRAAMVQWYVDLFDKIIQSPSVYEKDYDFVTAAVGENFLLQADELLPQIEKIHELDLIDEMAHGDWKGFQEHYANPYERKRPLIASIYERYEDALKTWHYYRMKYEEKYRKKHTYTPPSPPKFAWDTEKQGTLKHEKKKVGRNEPCPCGSGKKYKKCCLKK